MIELTIAAQLSAKDINRHQMLIDGQVINQQLTEITDVLPEDKETTFLATNKRESHVILGLSTDAKIYNPEQNHKRLAKWQELYQKRGDDGLTGLLSALNDSRITCDYLCVIDARLHLFWLPDNLRLLWLKNKEVRLVQPVSRPDHVFNLRYLKHCHFYCLNLRPQESLLCITLQQADELATYLAGQDSQKLIDLSPQNLMSFYKQKHKWFEKRQEPGSWFGYQVNRGAYNYLQGNNKLLYQQFKLSPKSKFLPGKMLRAVPYLDEAQSKQVNVAEQRELQAILQRGYLIQRREQEVAQKLYQVDNVRSKFSDHEREKTLQAFSSRLSEKEQKLIKAQEFTLDPYKEKGFAKLQGWFFRSEKRWLNRLVAVTSCLLFLVLLVFFGRLVHPKTEEKTSVTTAQVSETVKYVGEKALVIPPQGELNLELIREVAAESVQIRQQAEAKAAVLKILKRGEQVKQLNEADEKGWVFVELADGTRGYVLLSYLK